MEWVAILGLGALLWAQSARLRELSRRLDAMERRLQSAVPSSFQSRPLAPTPSAPKPEAEDLEPLLLDTPLPEPSNDFDEAGPPAAALPPKAPPEPSLARPRLEPRPWRTMQWQTQKLEKWVAENGLAWLGGGLLAFGGIFFVAYAGQQSWFTPRVQLACAIAFALALLAGSEWVRRQGKKRPPGNPLVASMLAAAAVVTFYAVAWAARGLYGLATPTAAGALLALCALLLGALALIHGQALGALAVLMAMLAPPFASMEHWPTAGLTLYVAGVGAAGFAVSAWRRWAWTAAVTALALYFWFAAAIAADDVRRALVMASIAALGGVSIAFRKPEVEAASERLAWSRLRADFPTVATCVSSALLLWTWASSATGSGSVAPVAWVGTMLVALAAAAVRARVAAPAAFAISAASLLIGFAGYLVLRPTLLRPGADFYPFILFSALAVAAAARFARAQRHGRVQVAAAGAVCAALLTALAAASRTDWRGPAAWAALLSASAALFAIAYLSARDVREPKQDQATAIWTSAAAALLFLGVESAFPQWLRPAAYGAASLALAGGLVWRGWSALRLAALSGAGLAAAHALSPAFVDLAMRDAPQFGAALLVLTAAAAFTFSASAAAARVEPRRYGSEGLSAAAITLTLTGAFLALRWIASGGFGAPLDGFTEASLRALALTAAGHIALQREGGGLIAKWRGHVLMGAGLAYALLAQAGFAHPSWGVAPAEITGPPVFNGLALAFAAPAALALAAAARLYLHQRNAARVYAAAGGLLALVWALSEVRRLFHGQAMAYAPLGLVEGACYGLIFLAGPLALARAARKRSAGSDTTPFTQDLASIRDGAVWFGLAVSVFLLLLARHPWWGAHYATSSGDLATLLAVLAQALAAGLCFLLARELARGHGPTRFAASGSAALFAWSFGHCALRWLYQRGGMDDGAAFLGLEGFAHALWPLMLALGVWRLLPKLERPHLADLRRIAQYSAWPALAFAVLGLWLVFCPWWGLAPAAVNSPLAALLAFAALAAAAWISKSAGAMPGVPAAAWFARTATLAALGHGFVLATLIVRWAFHRQAMASGAPGNIEMWAYSATWALLGASAYRLGAQSQLVRRAGLGLLLATTAKVLLLDMSELSGFVRVGSFVGLGAVLLAIAWGARRSSAARD